MYFACMICRFQYRLADRPWVPVCECAAIQKVRRLLYNDTFVPSFFTAYVQLLTGLWGVCTIKMPCATELSNINICIFS